MIDVPDRRLVDPEGELHHRRRGFRIDEPVSLVLALAACVRVTPWSSCGPGPGSPGAGPQFSRFPSLSYDPAKISVCASASICPTSA